MLWPPPEVLIGGKWGQGDTEGEGRRSLRVDECLQLQEIILVRPELYSQIKTTLCENLL